jgi:hypothetical protein
MPQIPRNQYQYLLDRHFLCTACFDTPQQVPIISNDAPAARAFRIAIEKLMPFRKSIAA